MKTTRSFYLFLTISTLLVSQIMMAVPRMEYLDRGLIGIQKEDGTVFLSWRLLAEDADEVSFNVYRRTYAEQLPDWGDFASTVDPTEEDVCLNRQALDTVTWFLDKTPHLQYRVALAWQNTAYNQPPHPSFYLDENVPLPPKPDIEVLPQSNGE